MVKREWWIGKGVVRYHPGCALMEWEEPYTPEATLYAHIPRTEIRYLLCLGNSYVKIYVPGSKRVYRVFLVRNAQSSETTYKWLALDTMFSAICCYFDVDKMSNIMFKFTTVGRLAPQIHRLPDTRSVTGWRCICNSGRASEHVLTQGLISFSLVSERRQRLLIIRHD